MTTPTATGSRVRPYKPSWIDRFTGWVDRLPVPASVFYVGLAFCLVLGQILFLWLEGGLGAEVLLPVIIFNGLATPFLLALMHHLDHQAASGLKAMGPVLDMAAPEFDQFQYKLSTMPFRVPVVAGLAMIVLVILAERLGATPVRYAVLE